MTPHIYMMSLYILFNITTYLEENKMTPPISNNQHKKETKLLRIMTGYVQHTSPFRLYTVLHACS